MKPYMKQTPTIHSLQKSGKLTPKSCSCMSGKQTCSTKPLVMWSLLTQKKLINNLLEIEGIKLCLSQIIPLEDIAQVKSVIRQVNRELSSFMTEMRRTDGNEKKIFTQNNDALGGFIFRTTGRHGVVVALNDWGKRKLWLHLKDGLNRTLQLAPFNTASIQSFEQAKNISQRNKNCNG